MAPALLPAALLALAIAPRPAAAAPPVCPAGSFAEGAGCRRCPDGTFSAAGRGSCSLCRRCEGIFRYLKECSPDGDAECTCRAGYRCGGAGCSRCERGCPAGQERARRGCQPCRYGTYNNQPNGFCKNWTKCSGNQVLEPGTPSKDVICKQASDNLNLVSEITADYHGLPTTSPTSPFSITMSGKDLQADMMTISLTVPGLLCLVVLLPSCICFSIWQKKKLHAVFKKMRTIPEQSIQEDDACSCHFPEEEQGEYQDCGKSTEFRDLLVK